MISKASALSQDRMKGILAVVVGTVAASAAVWVLTTGPAAAISLADAVREAVNTNPDIGVVAKDRRAIDHELRQAKALYLPSVDARVAYGPEWTEQVAGNLPGNQGRLYRSEQSVTLTQLLFDGFAAASEVQRQKFRVESAALRVAETSESVGLDAVQAYLDVVRQGDLLKLAEENRDTHQKTLDDMKARLRGGTGSMADVRQAEARLARAYATVAETRGALEDAKANYIRAVGQAPEDLSRPAGVFDLLPNNVDLAVAQSLEENPRIAVANADVGVAKAELRASAADFYPKFDLQVSALRDRNINGVHGTSSSEQALVVMTWNLFRGGETTAKNEEYVSRLAEAREVVGQAKIRAEQETRLSWDALESAKERRQALEIQVKANEKVRDAYIQQFNLGQRSLLDVLDSTNELFVSRGDLITAQFVELFAGYRMLAVQGRLLSALGVSNRPEASVRMASTAPEMPKMADTDEVAPATTPVATTPAAETPAAATADQTAPAKNAKPTAEATPAKQAPAAAPEKAASTEPVPVTTAPPTETETQPTPAATASEQPATQPAPAATAEEAPTATAPASGPAAKPAEVQSAQAPTEGFKDANAAKTSDDALMSLTLNPAWSVQ